MSIGTESTLECITTQAGERADADQSAIGGKRTWEFAGTENGSGLAVGIWIAVVHEPARFSTHSEGAAAACRMPEEFRPAVPPPFGRPLGRSLLEVVPVAAEKRSAATPRAAASYGMRPGRRIRDCYGRARDLMSPQEVSTVPYYQVTESRSGRAGRASSCRATRKRRRGRKSPWCEVRVCRSPAVDRTRKRRILVC